MVYDQKYLAKVKDILADFLVKSFNAGKMLSVRIIVEGKWKQNKFYKRKLTF